MAESLPLHLEVLRKSILGGLKTVEERRGCTVDLQPPNIIRNYHKNDKQQEEDLGVVFKEPLSIGAFDPFKIYPSIKPLQKLSRIPLRQLRLEIQNVDKYVIVRVLEPAIQTIGWSSVIEDEDGIGCYLDVYNYPKRELFCVGTVLVIKEPYFKIAASGQPTIRCDCPTDIIVLRRSHQLYGEMAGAIKWKNELGKVEPHEEFLSCEYTRYTTTKWKDLGNQLFRQNHSSLAKECYSMGLMKTWKMSDSLYKSFEVNLCAIDLDLGNYETALISCLSIHDDVRTLFGAGLAFYNLRRYSNAVETFEKVVSEYPECREGPIQLEKAQLRVSECQSFDEAASIERLSSESGINPFLLLDHADYAGPIKLIKASDGKRKAIVTEDVKSDTVLLVSKALTCKLRHVRGPRVSMDRSTFRVWELERYDLELIADMVQVIAKNPETLADITYNIAVGELPSHHHNFYCDREKKREVNCDVELIRKTWYRHHFPITSVVDGQIKETGAGFFVLPAYISHSCIPNVYCVFYNNIMVVYSLYDLKADDDVMISYVTLVGRSYEERKQNLEWRGITCECENCRNEV